MFGYRRLTLSTSVSGVPPPSAASALVTAARTGPSGPIRGQALFWIAQRAGAQAIPTIAEAIERDPETDVKKRAVFALSQLPANEGVPKLIETLDQLGGKVRADDAVSRRRRRARYLIARAASDIVANRVKAGGRGGLDTLADSVLSGTMTPHAAATRLLED